MVGLDAALFGPDSTDYMVETPRENLLIARLLIIPLGADALGIAATITAVMTLAATQLAEERSKWDSDLQDG